MYRLTATKFVVSCATCRWLMKRLSAFFRRASPIRYSLQTLLSDESDLSDSSDTHFRSKWRSRSASATGSQRLPPNYAKARV